jgi:uncharacterized CHY-type Zn-finger protein
MYHTMLCHSLENCDVHIHCHENLKSHKNVKIKIHKTIILCIVCNGCRTWPLTLVEDHSGLNVREQMAEENIWA